MSEQTSVIRLKPEGDAEKGLQPAPWEMDVIEGTPDKMYHLFFSRKPETMGEISAGVSTGQGYSEKIVDYPCDEIGFVLEGSVTIIDTSDHEQVFAKGECFFIRQGFSGIWKQSDNFKKFYMMVCY